MMTQARERQTAEQDQDTYRRVHTPDPDMERVRQSWWRRWHPDEDGR